MPRGALVAAMLALLPVPASAQDWPTRPVRIVNTFAAGGAADVMARLVADHLSSAFNQQFFVETRAGAGGLIGLKSVLDTEPDGHNLVLTTQSLLVLGPMQNPKLGYDPLRDLTHIAYIAGSPIVFVVNRASGVRTLGEFVVRAKAADKPLTYSSSGFGGNGHLVAELFAQQAGVRFEHVPYKGAAQGLTDLVGGHIAFSSQTVSSSAGFIRAGTLTALAHSASARFPDYPDMPTFRELGYGDLVATTWFAISGPARLPPAIVEKANREIVKALAKPAVQQRLRQDGMISEAFSAVEFVKFIVDETARWRPVLERAGLAGK
jgi:tripartite-type tricarboxylate transporter receptor subunit TctC